MRKTKNRFLPSIIIFACVLGTASCSSSAKRPLAANAGSSNRGLASSRLDLTKGSWELVRVDLKMKGLRGECDLDRYDEKNQSLKVTVTAQHEQKRPGGVIIGSVRSDGNTCALTPFLWDEGRGTPLHSNYLGATLEFRISNPRTLVFGYEVGYVASVENMRQVSHYTKDGYQQIGAVSPVFAPDEAIMFKQVATEPGVQADCSEVGTKGLIGFRTAVVTCVLSDEQGSITIEEI